MDARTAQNPTQEASGDGTAAGLTSAEAARRLAEDGPNEVAERRRNPVLAFLARYWGPMPWLLELAAVLALAVGHATEAVVIAVLLTVNAVVGQLQSSSARRAVELLRRDLAVGVSCRRDGAWGEVAARELVVGDVVSLGLGRVVPADVRVLSGDADADLSSLTGESLPRTVAAGDELPAGSVVARGAVTAVVTATGERSGLGRTAALVRDAAPRSRQQELLFSIVRYMMYLGVAASVVVGGYALVRGDGLVDVASLVITFLMGAVPVALPAVLAIVQAAGALALSREGVLVTRLDSVEDAASIDVFCLDKTGTLTTNQLEVTEVVPLGGHTAAEVVRAAALASEATGSEAIDAAIRRRAQADGVGAAGARQLSYVPFDPAAKRTEATAELADGTRVLLVKGAPRVVAGLAATDAETLGRAVEGLSARGLRCVAVASGTGEKDLEVVGLLGLADPPRDDAAELVGRLRALGVRPLMLTGDDAAIAREVAAAVGVGGRVRRAAELRDAPHDAQLALVEGSDGFAEVLPADKHLIVHLLQEAGHSVGMTGDGVNDAPALAQAELGCAAPGATDVARGAASAVLTGEGLAGIVDALTESRRAYQRMLTWVINKVTKVVESVVLLAAGYVLTGSMLVSLLGMSLLIFANDFATMSIATDNVRATTSPNGWDLHSIVRASAVLGALFAVEELVVAWLAAGPLGLGAGAAPTLVMYALVVNSQVRILTVRERGHAWASRPSRGMLIVAAAVTVGFTALVLAGVAVPAVTPEAVAATLAVCAAGGAALDFAKVALFRRFHVA
ncbi:plasma-membrane proton-efflux P-type ATPase [Olsenella profusa]|uniref:Plasma-membrane proton-efflux P-type ATPase n=1 Tax=Olsenella profusa TaxID=138595 RepID=A0ABS2F2D2_9ACTN|nr:plasma-membrane proton-efflux P-type ATPase [Olsenella profusa]MBM6775136.1 plasma-membrane proton-efflux P-type ATPase [Olsenella profusa]